MLPDTGAAPRAVAAIAFPRCALSLSVMIMTSGRAMDLDSSFVRSQTPISSLLISVSVSEARRVWADAYNVNIHSPGPLARLLLQPARTSGRRSCTHLLDVEPPFFLSIIEKAPATQLHDHREEPVAVPPPPCASMPTPEIVDRNLKKEKPAELCYGMQRCQARN